jgi:hypothetical protein
VLSGKLKHKDELLCRLNFLKFLSDHSSTLELTYEQLEVIWRLLVQEKITTLEPELLLFWMGLVRWG